MKLVTSPTSPYGRKIRAVLAEKKIEFELVFAKPGVDDELITQYNPLGKVPVLILDDGRVIFDSPVIAEYLDHSSPVGRLSPSDHRTMISMKKAEALADGITDAAVTIVLESRRPAEQQSEIVVERQKAKIQRGLAALDIQLKDRRFLLGENYSLADIAAVCMLDFLDLRLADLGWQHTYPLLAQYRDRLNERAALAETRPE